MHRATSEPIASERLRLEPLSVEHAPAMVDALADASIYEYTGGDAPSLEQLQRRYATQVVGQSDDGSQRWFNWIVKLRDGGGPMGFVQATVEQHGPDCVAEIAWLMFPAHQGQGYASEATTVMTSWLRSNGVTSFVAHVHPEHRASMGVARNQALHPTALTKGGEVRWESSR